MTTPPLNTTVIVDDVDLGVGETDRVVFVDSKYVVDDEGNLHVHRNDGNVGTFPKGSWRFVIRGSIVRDSDVTQVNR